MGSSSHEQSLIDWIFKSIASLSIVVCISSQIPQILKIYKTKSSTDISRTSLIINLSGIVLMQTYAFYFNLWEIFIPNVVSCMFVVVIIIMKSCYDNNMGVLDRSYNNMGNNDDIESNVTISPMKDKFSFQFDQFGQLSDDSKQNLLSSGSSSGSNMVLDS